MTEKRLKALEGRVKACLIGETAPYAGDVAECIAEIRRLQKDRMGMHNRIFALKSR